MATYSSFFFEASTIGGKRWCLLIFLLSSLFSLGRVWISTSSISCNSEYYAVISSDTQKLASKGKPESKGKPASKGTVAYAITVTECSSSWPIYLDGAAVLSYSIHKNSIRHASSGSRYDYKLYAFLDANAADCTDALEKLGYHVRFPPLPIEEEEIREPLRTQVRKRGCCGAKEFLKLYSYTLTEHPIVVHLDTDTLFLKPFDVLYDSMLEGPFSPARKRLPYMWTNEKLPDNIEAFFVRDYVWMEPGDRTEVETGVNGGLLIVKPSFEIYEKYRETIREGDFEPEVGWGHSKGLRYGGYWGDAQIQGLCAYFFGDIRPGTAVELDRCRVSSVADKPFARKAHDHCIESRCEDCRRTNVSEIYSVHYTDCGKPWYCLSLRDRELQRGLCRAFHEQWFQHRHELETRWSFESEAYNSTLELLGHNYSAQEGRKLFCDGGYRPIRVPHGTSGKST